MCARQSHAMFRAEHRQVHLARCGWSHEFSIAAPKFSFYLAFAEGGPRLKMQTVFFILGGSRWWIGWICSRDLFETSWEGLHEVLTIVIAEESRTFTCALSLSHWRCYHNFEPLRMAYERTPGCGRSWRTFLKRFWLRWSSPLFTAEFCGLENVK